MKLRAQLAWSSFFMLSLAGCGSSLSPLASEALAPPGHGNERDRITIPIEPNRVRVEARVKTVTTHTLRFGQTTGRWSAPRGRLDQSRIELDFDMQAVTSEPQKLADLAMSENFLDARSHPRGHLNSRWFRPRPSTQSPRYDLFLDLVLKDRRQHLVVPADFRRVGCDIQFATTFSVERRAFGIAGPARYDSVVGDKVEVKIQASVPVAPFGVACVEPAPPA